ncbi:hypothetical protein [Bacteroides uniformis]|uniref:hypothetical protein n=1 Tax=Bacteroides uniformis TaxID=820 RepID=UPI00216542C5|nr:hypothetical protein [Bacteroides uniformis]MCS3298015.1 hypothetical protein [Bacteroides uniformis]
MKKNLLITCVMLLFAVVSMAQNKITVSGVVSDKTGMTVIGATVSVKGLLSKESLLDLMVIIRLPMFPVTLSCFIAILV